MQPVRVLGIDPSREYLAAARRGGSVEVVVGSATAIPTASATFTRRLDVVGRATAEFSIPSPVPLAGRVVDAATRLPVAASVEVTTTTPEGLSVHVAGLAGSDGAYLLEVPRGRAQSFLVIGGDYAPYPSAAESKAVLGSLRGLNGTEAVQHDVALRPGSVVRGLVTLTGTKQPVPSLTLRFAQGRGPAARSVTTGDDGAYVMKGLAPGDWRVLIETPGWFAKPDGDRVRVPEPSTDLAAGEARLDLEVWSSGRLLGRVVKPDGTPVAQARVWLVGGNGIVRGARRAGRPLETLSGADGGFLVEDVPPHVSVRVRATLGDAEAVPSREVRLADGAPPPIVLTLAPTVRVTGAVTALDTHEPVAGARVQVDPVGEPGGRGGRSVTTGPDGRFDVASLIPGAWRLTANLKRAFLPGLPVHVTLAAEPLVVDVPLALDPGFVVAGVVVDPEGRAVLGAVVSLDGTEDVGNPAPPVARKATTDARGSFRFSGLRSGRYGVKAQRQGFIAAALDGLRGGEDRLTLPLTSLP